MRIKKLMVATLCLSALPIVLAAQIVTEMTPDLIEQAIKDGQQEPKKKGFLSGMSRRPDEPQPADACYPLNRKTSGFVGMNLFMGCYSTPYSRVAGAAKNAKAVYKPFTKADVTPEMIAPEAWIIAASHKARYGPGMADVVAVVVAPAKSKDRSQAILPTRSDESTSEYKNAMGASFEGKSIVAVFPLSVLSDENEVRVVYDKEMCGAAECAVRFKLDKVR